MDTRLGSSVFHVKLQPWKDSEGAVNERWIDMFHASRYNMDLAEFEKATTANKVQKPTQAPTGQLSNNPWVIISQYHASFMRWDGHKIQLHFFLNVDSLSIGQ
jgi:hypothetical protein